MLFRAGRRWHAVLRRILLFPQQSPLLSCAADGSSGRPACGAAGDAEARAFRGDGGCLAANPRAKASGVPDGAACSDVRLLRLRLILLSESDVAGYHGHDTAAALLDPAFTEKTAGAALLRSAFCNDDPVFLSRLHGRAVRAALYGAVGAVHGAGDKTPADRAAFLGRESVRLLPDRICLAALSDSGAAFRQKRKAA